MPKVVGGLTVVSLWCYVAVCRMIFSAAAKSSSGELGDASMPLNLCLIGFKGTEDCRVNHAIGFLRTPPPKSKLSVNFIMLDVCHTHKHIGSLSRV